MVENSRVVIPVTPRPLCFQWRVMMIQGCLVHANVMIIFVCTSEIQDIKIYRRSTGREKEPEKAPENKKSSKLGRKCKKMTINPVY